MDIPIDFWRGSKCCNGNGGYDAVDNDDDDDGEDDDCNGGDGDGSEQLHWDQILT